MYENSLKPALSKADIFSFIGVYDVFSTTIAAKYFDGIFLSGFGFAASYYGMPDIGFNTWTDIVAYAQRIKSVAPECHILVDIDDGFIDTEVACHVVSLLESIGVSGIIVEDQKRPRRCGHFKGKQIMEQEAFLRKLEKILAVRKELFVVARTDAEAEDEIKERALAFADAGADAILIDAIENIELVKDLRSQINLPFVFNRIAGGKSPLYSNDELRNAGIKIVVYSTPCLFAAQMAIDEAMRTLKKGDGLLPTDDKSITVQSCTAILNNNLKVF